MQQLPLDTLDAPETLETNARFSKVCPKGIHRPALVNDVQHSTVIILLDPKAPGRNKHEHMFYDYKGNLNERNGEDCDIRNTCIKEEYNP